MLPTHSAGTLATIPLGLFKSVNWTSLMFVVLVLLLNICNCIKSNIICPVTEQNIQEVCDGQCVAWIIYQRGLYVAEDRRLYYTVYSCIYYCDVLFNKLQTSLVWPLSFGLLTDAFIITKCHSTLMKSLHTFIF